jgi:hypothetical protein
MTTIGYSTEAFSDSLLGKLLFSAICECKKGVEIALPKCVLFHGSSASSVLDEQKPRGEHMQTASLSHLLALLSGYIRQQHATCGRAITVDTFGNL